MGGRPTVHTVNGHALPEVVSALQKAIRRSQIDDAMYWAVDMDLSGYGKYLWKRLLLIASEDVGLAAPGATADVRACYENWTEFKKEKKDGRLFIAHAVVALAAAPKSRLTDWALITHYSAHGDLKREIPDYALDRHTLRGKRMQRGVDHFIDEGARLQHAGVFGSELTALEEHYREEARRYGNEGRVSAEASGVPQQEEMPL